MLKDEPRQKLAEIIAHYGKNICEHKQRCKGLVLDYCHGYDREVNVLVLMLQMDIPAQLLNISSEVATESLVNRLTIKVCDKWAMNKEAAHWGVEAWASALGMKMAVSTINGPPSISSPTLFVQPSTRDNEGLKDFFLIYHSIDRFWGEWIAWYLEEAGHMTIVPHWDFHAGTDLLVEMRKTYEKAKRIIAILSPDYFAMHNNLEEWATIFGSGRLIPVLVRKCGPEYMKFLQSIVYIDITECEETDAHQLLLAGIQHERLKPILPPPFPGQRRKPTMEDCHHFSGVQTIRDYLQLDQQIISLIRAAFNREDWSNVLQKTSPLLNADITHELSPELYQLHGMALFYKGKTEQAEATLKTALALENNTEKHLTILKDYTNVLKTLGRWNEVLSHADTALQQIPSEKSEVALRREAVSQIRSNLIPVSQGIEVFFSYSLEDKALRYQLEKYLSNFKRQRIIVGWYDGEVSPGSEWDSEIKKRIDRAHIILLLVSQDFLASDRSYEKEMKRALERHNAGKAHVIPIILRPAHWEVTPFGKLQALPTKAKPVTRWSNRDEAFLDIVKGIQRVVDELM